MSETIPANGLFDGLTAPPTYVPQPARCFAPHRIILAKGSLSTPDRQQLAHAICQAYPKATVEEQLDTHHNKIDLGQSENSNCITKANEHWCWANYSAVSATAMKTVTPVPITGTFRRMVSAPMVAITVILLGRVACVFHPLSKST